jgi:hypothetical protein
MIPPLVARRSRRRIDAALVLHDEDRLELLDVLRVLGPLAGPDA